MRSKYASAILILALLFIQPTPTAQAGFLGNLLSIPFRVMGAVMGAFTGGRMGNQGGPGPRGGMGPGGGMMPPGNNGFRPPGGGPPVNPQMNNRGGIYPPGGTNRGSNYPPGTANRNQRNPNANNTRGAHNQNTGGVARNKRRAEKPDDNQDSDASESSPAFPSYDDLVSQLKESSTNAEASLLNQNENYGGFCRTSSAEPFPAVLHLFKEIGKEKKEMGLAITVDENRGSENWDFWQRTLMRPSDVVLDLLENRRKEIASKEAYSKREIAADIGDQGAVYVKCKNDKECVPTAQLRKTKIDGRDELIVSQPGEKGAPNSVCLFDLRMKDGKPTKQMPPISGTTELARAKDSDGPKLAPQADRSDSDRAEKATRPRTDPSDSDQVTKAPQSVEHDRNLSSTQERQSTNEYISSQNAERQAQNENTQTLNPSQPNRAPKHQVQVVILSNPPACGPCREIAPMVNQVVSAYSQREGVNIIVTANSEEYGERGWPYILVWVDGKPAQRLPGQSIGNIPNLIENYLANGV